MLCGRLLWLLVGAGAQLSIIHNKMNMSKVIVGLFPMARGLMVPTNDGKMLVFTNQGDNSLHTVEIETNAIGEIKMKFSGHVIMVIPSGNSIGVLYKTLDLKKELTQFSTVEPGGSEKKILKLFYYVKTAAYDPSRKILYYTTTDNEVRKYESPEQDSTFPVISEVAHAMAFYDRYLYWTTDTALYKYADSGKPNRLLTVAPAEMPYVQSIVFDPEGVPHICHEQGLWRVRRKTIEVSNVTDECWAVHLMETDALVDDGIYFWRIRPEPFARVTTTTPSTPVSAGGPTTTEDATTNTVTTVVTPPMEVRVLVREEPLRFSMHSLPLISGTLMLAALSVFIALVFLCRGDRNWELTFDETGDMRASELETL